MTPGKKYTLSTSAFYVLFLLLTPLAERFSPGGPCVPGGGILLILLIPLLAGLGFVVSFAVLTKGNRAFMGPMIINGCLFVGSLLLFNYGRFL
jgi:peptidoglycan/LPS O-acetylase OafA/YrhL